VRQKSKEETPVRESKGPLSDRGVNTPDLTPQAFKSAKCSPASVMLSKELSLRLRAAENACSEDVTCSEKLADLSPDAMGSSPTATFTPDTLPCSGNGMPSWSALRSLHSISEVKHTAGSKIPNSVCKTPFQTCGKASYKMAPSTPELIQRALQATMRSQTLPARETAQIAEVSEDPSDMLWDVQQIMADAEAHANASSSVEDIDGIQDQEITPAALSVASSASSLGRIRRELCFDTPSEPSDEVSAPPVSSWSSQQDTFHVDMEAHHRTRDVVRQRNQMSLQLIARIENQLKMFHETGALPPTPPEGQAEQSAPLRTPHGTPETVAELLRLRAEAKAGLHKDCTQCDSLRHDFQEAADEVRELEELFFSVTGVKVVDSPLANAANSTKTPKACNPLSDTADITQRRQQPVEAPLVPMVRGRRRANSAHASELEADIQKAVLMGNFRTLGNTHACSEEAPFPPYQSSQNVHIRGCRPSSHGPCVVM